MSIRSHKFITSAALAVALGVGAAAVVPAEAEARHWRGHRTGAFVGGVIGGLALGGLVYGATRPAYAAPYGYYGAPAYSYGPAYYGPNCYWTRQRVQVDPWTYQVRRVRVCH
jgi:hypothetical protein